MKKQGGRKDILVRKSCPGLKTRLEDEGRKRKKLFRREKVPVFALWVHLEKDCYEGHC